jgi:hypothetical protein
MDVLVATTVQFRLAPSALSYCVDVRLRRVGDRWIAVAEMRGASQVGLGVTARAALAAALMSLPDAETRMLLADTTLFGASAEIAVLDRARSA